MKQLYTVSQLAKLSGRKQDIINKILLDVPPDGSVSRWPGYSWETFKSSAAAFSQVQMPVDDDVEPIHSNGDLKEKYNEQQLRWKSAQAEALELTNLERKSALVPKKDCDDFFRFTANLFSEQLKFVLGENKEQYNMICEATIRRIEDYVNDKQVSNMIQDVPSAFTGSNEHK